MTDLDDKVHRTLAAFAAHAPLPLSVKEIEGRPNGRRPRRHLLAGVAAAAVLAAAIGGLAIRSGGDDAASVSAAGEAEPSPRTSAQLEVDFAVFMNPAASETELTAVRNLLDDPRVAAFTYIGQDAALEQFRRTHADDPDLLEGVSAEDLPSSFRVALVDQDLTAASDLLSALRGSPGVVGVDTTPFDTPPASTTPPSSTTPSTTEAPTTTECAHTSDTVPDPCTEPPPPDLETVPIQPDGACPDGTRPTDTNGDGGVDACAIP